MRGVEKVGEIFTDGYEEPGRLKKTSGLEQYHLPEAKDMCGDSCGEHENSFQDLCKYRSE